jgi:simple sugar transport system permease protein
LIGMSTATAPPPALDERVARVSIVRALLVKPEFGSVIGAVVLFIFFAVQSAPFRQLGGIANWLDPASTYGIMAVAVALLMIGGHFDLSAGVQLATAGLVTSILTVNYHLYVWVSVLVS